MDTMLSMRLEKNKLIKTITFSEKFIYKNVDISTVVSNRDKKLIYSLYKVKPYIFRMVIVWMKLKWKK